MSKKTRPQNYGRACYGINTIIDCPQGGKPLTPDTPIARPAGRCLDPERAINPNAHGDIPYAQNDAYNCPRCPAYVRLTKAGVVRKHRRKVSTDAYNKGFFDV